MSLRYKSQLPFPIIGTKTSTGTRTSVTLAGTYGTAKAFKVAGYSKLNLDVLYTMGAAETSNSIELLIEQSSDGVNYYRIPNETVTAGTSTLTAREFTFVGTNAAAATISIGLDIFYKYVRVSVKETGVGSNFGTAYVEGTLSGL